MTVVIREPRKPAAPLVELAPTTLGETPAWQWAVRSDGRLVGFGIRQNRSRAIAQALESFPDAEVEP